MRDRLKVSLFIQPEPDSRDFGLGPARTCAGLPCAALALAALVTASCGGKAPPPAAQPHGQAGTSDAGAPSAVISPSPEGSASTLTYRVSPSRLFPELVGARGQVAVEDGARRMLVDRMRLVVHADGSMERAVELLPAGSVWSVALPSRLGGGYLFHTSGRGYTEIWRASSWLDKLTPLARISDVVSDIVAGFDRLYLRMQVGNRVIALDAKDGKHLGLGPLPVAAGYGMLAFADGWRAVVDTDLRGPLTTFDAGATWRPVGVSERVQAVGIVDNNPAVLVQSGRYIVDPRGIVSFRSDRPEVHERAPEDDPRHAADDTAVRAPSPLGKRPLRAAVEDGWPDSATTAVVARGGALARVSLADGRVIAIADDAYPDRRSTCHAARLGLHGVGFLCGERDGKTTVYAFAPPLAMRTVLSFDKPRYVAASGNGALVVRGRCEGPSPGNEETDARWYCVRTPAGDMREIRVKSADHDLGVERVVGLGDGRIAVIVPPRAGTSGSLSVITGNATATVALELPSDAHGAARELKRGLWLDGFEERRPGVLGGWVEAGGRYLGMEIGLDGKVKAGEVREDAYGGIFGGRFAVALADGGHAFETSDGGMSWAPFDLPDREEEARAAPSRACGPVGCALPGWVRVGWGDPEDLDDMKPARTPTTPYAPYRMSPTLHFACGVASVATPPLADKHAAAPPPRPVRGRGAPAAPARPAHGALHDTPWAPFRNMEPPALAADEYGIDNGPGSADATGLRVYAWGKAGADWTRGARWLVRFEDRFDTSGGVRSSALTASLWATQTEAVEGIGTSPYGNPSWAGFLDPSGRTLLASSCRGQVCAMYSVGEGQPVLPLRSGGGLPMRPYEHGAVRVGETWFYLTSTPSYDGIALWRADLGVARLVAKYNRVIPRYSNFAAPRLVRRAIGAGIGMLIPGGTEPGERTGSWFVLPVDPETGALGDAIALARRDLADTPLSRCTASQDGWTFDVTPEATTAVDVDNATARFEPVELRLRLDPGRACIESLAARTDPFFAREAPSAAAKGPPRPLTSVPARKAVADEGSVAMAATEKLTGRRWGLSCKVQR
jgi:hypothetical protein